MKTITKFAAIALLVAGMTGCGKEKEKMNNEDAVHAFLMKLESLSLSHVDGNNFSEWLSIKINEIETVHSGDISIVKVKIYRGEWNGQIVYLIKDNLKSTGWEVYYDNGEYALTDKDKIANFCTSSINWRFIYEFGNFTISTNK